MTEPQTKTCRVCKKAFMVQRRHAATCSPRCRQRFNRHPHWYPESVTVSATTPPGRRKRRKSSQKTFVHQGAIVAKTNESVTSGRNQNEPPRGRVPVTLSDAPRATIVIGKLKVVPDAKWSGMWRVQYREGALSDMVNLSRAKDAALNQLQ
jgi:hypothetical protein